MRRTGRCRIRQLEHVIWQNTPVGPVSPLKPVPPVKPARPGGCELHRESNNATHKFKLVQFEALQMQRIGRCRLRQHVRWQDTPVGPVSPVKPVAPADPVNPAGPGGCEVHCDSNHATHQDKTMGCAPLAIQRISFGKSRIRQHVRWRETPVRPVSPVKPVAPVDPVNPAVWTDCEVHCEENRAR